MQFVINFLYISLSASIYSKDSKTKSCLFVDIRIQIRVAKYNLEENNVVIKCVYILVFFTMLSYSAHGTNNVTFFMVPKQGYKYSLLAFKSK